ncbi:MAG: right-handed parallel beta-helix repeat-containing protein [Candidatus Woesearchaeota archaeon]
MKKLIIVGLILVLLASAVAAEQMCKMDDVRDNLKKALFKYAKNPGKSTLSIAELMQLTMFYLANAEEEQTECSGQTAILDKAKGIDQRVPVCGDGTHYGKCSSRKPLYCFNKRLVERCKLCGCPEDQECVIYSPGHPNYEKYQWGRCEAGVTTCSGLGGDVCLENETCPGSSIEASDTERCCSVECVVPTWDYCSECGSGIFNICDENECMAIAEECYFSSGSCDSCSSASCGSYPSEMTCGMDACGLGCEWDGVECVEEQLFCPDGTEYDSCSATKPFYCNDGVLLPDCELCGCEGEAICDTDLGSCSVADPTCVTPVDGMSITSDTTFCSGTYSLLNGVLVSADGIALDCNNAEITGIGSGNGVLINSDGVTVRGCNLDSFSVGIRSAGFGNTMEANLISGSTYFAISSGNNDSIISNVLVDNKNGIDISLRSFVVASGNMINSSRTYGILLDKANDCEITGNTIVGCGWDPAYTYRGGISLAYTCLRNSIRGNTLVNNQANNLLLRGRAPDELPSDNVILDNDIYTTGISDENSAGNVYCDMDTSLNNRLYDGASLPDNGSCLCGSFYTSYSRPPPGCAFQ